LGTGRNPPDLLIFRTFPSGNFGVFPTGRTVFYGHDFLFPFYTPPLVRTSFVTLYFIMNCDFSVTRPLVPHPRPFFPPHLCGPINWRPRFPDPPSRLFFFSPPPPPSLFCPLYPMCGNHPVFGSRLKSSQFWIFFHPQLLFATSPLPPIDFYVQ